MNNSTNTENATETVTNGDGDESIVSGSIPLPLLLVMSTLAALGICYSLALLFFNVVHRKKKIIKMTSPNVNIVILLGCCIAFIVIALLGFSSPTIPRHIIPKTLQACVFLLPLSFTMIYGSLFAKVVRIHMIFTNLSFNGKDGLKHSGAGPTRPGSAVILRQVYLIALVCLCQLMLQSTRDEHLLLGVAALMLLDLAILLPWQLIDPITCHISTWKTTDASSNVTHATEECSSELQVVWISLVYAYKVVMLSFGLYFTWQTRFVTLPSIRDARLIFGSVQSVALLGLTAFPILLVTSESAIIKYSVGSLAIWFSLMTTMTFLFIPKVRLLWMEMRKRETAEDSNAAARMQFSESMTKTKNAASKCSNCFFCCCIRSTVDNEDRYAEEILATEIETLKRTIKEKDLTIRELTDRLYVGTEKFQQYLTTKTNRGYDVAWPPQPVISQQHRCNGACHACPTTPHYHHPPNEDCPSCMADYRCRSTGCPVRVNDPHQRLQPIIPRGQLDRRDELRNYRLSRYYREDEEENEDYDSRSFSDGSCSTCAAADLLEMQMRDAELQRRRMPAADGPRELSAATLSFSYDEEHRGVQTIPRSTSSTAALMYHRRYPPGSSSFQPRSFRPVDERAASSAQDSAYDNSPSSTESAAELVNSSRRPNRTTRVQRTVEARNYDGHTDPQIVGVFSVHRPPTAEDSVAPKLSNLERRLIVKDTNLTPTMAVVLASSTNQQTQMTSSTNGSRSHAPPTPTNHRLQGTVSINHQIPHLDLNLSSAEPVISNSQNESSLQLVSSDPLKRNGENTLQLATESQYAINSLDGFSGIRTYGMMSVTQI